MVTRKVAIACQGGGAHAAFTWGVLTEILQTKKAWDQDPVNSRPFDIVAFSGTSAGALCALAAWYGLTGNKQDAECGTIDKAIERLDFLWTTFAATTPIEHAHNLFVQDGLKVKETGAPFPDVDPYSPLSQWTLNSLAALGARGEYLGFQGLLESMCPHFASIDWEAVARNELRLLVGAVEVYSGNFEVFDSEKSLFEMGLPSSCPDGDQYGATRWRMRRQLTLEGIAASGTLPEVLPAQRIEGLTFPSCQPGKTVRRDGYYWDGLYSQNPPVRDLLNASEKARKPDEIWVIRINPQEYNLSSAQVGLNDIRDRVNSLAGNLSLNQELDHILSVNGWIEKHGNTQPPLDQCKVVDIRTIKMTQETASRLRVTSKLDRSAEHFEQLCEEGKAVAQRWLSDWRRLGRSFDSYPNDARYPEAG